MIQKPIRPFHPSLRCKEMDHCNKIYRKLDSYKCRWSEKKKRKKLNYTSKVYKRYLYQCDIYEKLCLKEVEEYEKKLKEYKKEIKKEEKNFITELSEIKISTPSISINLDNINI